MTLRKYYSRITKIIKRIENGESKDLKVYQDLGVIYHFLYGNTYDYEGQADIVEGNTPEDVSKIIDGGCGTGGLTKILGERFPESKVLGIDLNGSMLDIGRQIVTEGNVEFKEKDILELNEEAEVFTLFGTTPHLDKNQLCGLFEKINTILPNNGVFVFDYKSPDVKKHEDGHCSIWSRETNNYKVKNPITTVYKDGEPFYVFSFEFTEKETGKKFYSGDIMGINLYRQEELEEMLKDSGFSNIKVRDEGDQNGIFIAKKK